LICCNTWCIVQTAGTDWVDPYDPTVVAENELLSAANAIEAAAKKLANLQERLRPKVNIYLLQKPKVNMNLCYKPKVS